MPAKVVLKEAPQIGSALTGWTGCESNPTPSECVVTTSRQRGHSDVRGIGTKRGVAQRLPGQKQTKTRERRKWDKQRSSASSCPCEHRSLRTVRLPAHLLRGCPRRPLSSSHSCPRHHRPKPRLRRRRGLQRRPLPLKRRRLEVKVYNAAHALLTEIADTNQPCGLAVTTPATSTSQSRPPAKSSASNPTPTPSPAPPPTAPAKSSTPPRQSQGHRGRPFDNRPLRRRRGPRLGL